MKYGTTDKMVSYYDIDDILAQEELMQVTSLLDFTYLAHLDPDYVHEHSNPLRAQTLDDENSDHDVGTKTGTKKQSQNYYLKEGTRFKMPIWSIDKWAEVGFAKISVPKHYGRRSRERLDADPVSVDLRYVMCLVESLFSPKLDLISVSCSLLRHIQN